MGGGMWARWWCWEAGNSCSDLMERWQRVCVIEAQVILLPFILSDIVRCVIIILGCDGPEILLRQVPP